MIDSPAIYGASPIDLGLIELSPSEMMAWLYCPIKVPGTVAFSIPDNLKQFEKIIDAVELDQGYNLIDKYVYLTAKTLWVTAENPGNRPGWHSDGFMTDDLNYIWSDCNGTLFWEPEQLTSFIQDHNASLAEMGRRAEFDPFHHVVYPNKHLLRLDQTVIHRVADVNNPRWRSFVKVSVSRNVYNLIGNSINHELGPIGEYVPRSDERDHPSKVTS